MKAPGSEFPFKGLLGLKINTTGSVSRTPSTSTSTSTAGSDSAPWSPSSRGRRSVPSMKELMPLTLSPSLSNIWGGTQSTASIPSDEGMADRVDDYLPEVLARDLELSAAVFAGRKMSAGAPLITVPACGEERMRVRTARMSSYSPYLAASAKVQSLGAIEEKDSMVSFVGGQGELPTAEHEHTSDESSSMLSHYHSDGAEPPAFRHRCSIGTAATSLGSVSGKPTHSPPFESHSESPYECSWIDVDSDREDHYEDTSGDCIIASLSPRPPTPPCPEVSSFVARAAPGIDSAVSRTQLSKPLHRKSHSVSGGSPTVAVRGHISVKCAAVPARPSTMNGPKISATSALAKSQFAAHQAAKFDQRSEKPYHTQVLPVNTVNLAALNPRQGKPSPQPPFGGRPSPVSDDVLDPDEQVPYTATNYESASPNTVFVRPATPPEPLRNVQSWLNSSLQPYPWTHQNDDAARAVPLPPDAIETLRVTVACFPETMLLTSSLTVETIRSYAKKMRHPVTELAGCLGEDPSQMSRKSLWRKVVSYRKGQLASDPKSQPRSPNSRQGSSMDSTSSEELDTPRPWSPVKNVFGHCSDYICDALYAHIVSYNYVSALVARNPAPLPGIGRANSISLRESHQQDDIPKKAASLLGLAASAEAAASMARSNRRVSSPFGDWNKGGIMTSQNTEPSSQDNALRVIQSGLLQCIARLVATAKLMAEKEHGEEKMVDVESKDADMFFMRSLCEIVRMAEEAS